MTIICKPCDDSTNIQSHEKNPVKWCCAGRVTVEFSNETLLKDQYEQKHTTISLKTKTKTLDTPLKSSTNITLKRHIEQITSLIVSNSTSSRVDISNFDRPSLLLILWKNSSCTFGKPPTFQDAFQTLEKNQGYIDIFFQVPFRQNFYQDEIDLSIYDRDCGWYAGRGKDLIEREATNVKTGVDKRVKIEK